MKRSYLVRIVVCVICLSSERSLAWWADGHRLITEGAVSHLPTPLQDHFRRHLPALKEHSAVEPPGSHWIDIDYYPEFFEGTFPRDLAVLISLYGQDVVYQNGVAPWTVGEYSEALAAQMAAATSAEDWTALLQTAGALAHYIEDLHNPLHLTLNYNGQLTGNYGIHARYEGQMVLRHLADLPATPAPATCVFLPSPVDTVFDGIDVHYWFVDSIMSADTANRGGWPYQYNEAYYTGMWNDTGEFTQVLFQDASQVVASAWYTAWVNAGSPRPMCPPGTGDFDGGGTTLTDLAFFVEALLTPSPQDATGDLSGDCMVNGEDIEPFVNLLLAP